MEANEKQSYGNFKIENENNHSSTNVVACNATA